MKARHLLPLLSLALLAVSLGASASAHVGSPEIFFDGDAGPYKVLVSIRPPDVVPGIAQISVRVDDADAPRVTLQPVYFSTGGDGAPRPDEAQAVKGDPGSFKGQLWLMEFGSSSVRVGIDGERGPGEVIVPVPAIATARRGIDAKLGILLGGLGLFLLAGAIALVGASVRESLVAPGEPVRTPDRRRARKVMALTAIFFAATLFLGNRWWTSVDGAYLRNMFKPIRLSAAARVEPSGRVLNLALEDPGWRNRRADDLVPDHGKLIHMFLMREPALEAFAHLHPVRVGSTSFDAPLPAAMPEGRYRVYADVVHENGLTETLTASIDVPSPPQAARETSARGQYDPDDSSFVGSPAGPASKLSDGSVMIWARESGAALKAEQLTTLLFSVQAPDGKPAKLESYMGMGGHAAIAREDGSVFVHLHPSGTVSMAAQQAFSEKARPGTEGRASKSAADHTDHAGGAKEGEQASMSAHYVNETGAISFPYSFPKPGEYRIWVQVKREGRVLTGVFGAQVQ
jgi:hypothetical protein